MVWIVEWTQPGQNEVHVSTWTTHGDALRSACNDMLQALADSWDLDDPDEKKNARAVNDLVSVGDFQTALNEYADYESERNDYEYAQYWSIYERDVNSYPKAPTLLLLDDPDEDEEEEEEDDDEAQDEPYQASIPGATCRGPNCGYASPDAYADKRDGTFVCYQCKMMSQVFGTTIK